MIDTKKGCKACGDGECDCEILISKRGSVIRVAGDDRRVCGAIRVEEEEAGTRDRAMTKSKLWETYYRMNQLKALLMILRARWGGVRWERKWMKFMTDEWVTTGNMAEEDGWNAKSVVYVAVRMFSRAMYVGETGNGLLKRIMSHVRRAGGGKTRQRVYKVMSRLGIHTFTWIPTWAWRRDVTRKTRMRKEGETIWQTGADMNQLGTERTEDRQGGRGFTVMGRRKRFRLVMRLEAKARGSVIMGDEEIRARNEEKKVRHKEESKRRGKMMAMATRLARRPWKKHEQEEAEKTKTGKEVIGMKRDKIKRLLRVIQQRMDTPSRSIAMMNLKKLIKARGDVVFTSVMMNSVMMSDKTFVKDVKKGLKAWCVQWEKVAKVLVVLNVTVAPKATKAMIDILNSIGSWGKKEKEECKCVCN
jgi:hypothetical protein